VTFDTLLSPALTAVGAPHVWITAMLVVLLCYRGWKAKRWPDTESTIELLAYGAGVYGATSLLRTGASMQVADANSFPALAGGVVLLLASIKGAWRVLGALRTEQFEALVARSVPAEAPSDPAN
jgi:hypothetical protein